MKAPKGAVCPRCHSTKIETVEHKGKEYPYCADCHFWSTSNQVEATWLPKTSS